MTCARMGFATVGAFRLAKLPIMLPILLLLMLPIRLPIRLPVRLLAMLLVISILRFRTKILLIRAVIA
jgi:hypothetical protein